MYQRPKRVKISKLLEENTGEKIYDIDLEIIS